MSNIYKVARDLAVLKSNITLSATFTTSSGTVEICFGDGATQTSNTPSNTYTKVQPYLINVLSDKSLITGITFNNQSLTSVSVEEFPNVTTLDIRDNLLNDSQISQLLIELDENGASSGTLQVDGNPYTEVSAEAQTALANLAIKGWTTDISWSPAYVPTLAWFDASDADTITVSGTVSGWADKSGNSRDLSQPTGSNQPAENVNTIDSKKVLTFFTSKYLTSSFTEVTPTGGITIIGVQQFRAVSLCNMWIAESTGDRLNLRRNNDNRLKPQLKIDASQSVPIISGTSNSTPFVGGFTYDSVDIKTWIDGVDSDTTTKIGTFSMDAFLFGWESNSCDSDVAEVVMVEGTDTALRQTVEGYLAHKWGLTANLDAGHPYKTTGPTI